MISTIPALSSIIGSLTAFALIFVVTYIPTAILLGRFEYARGELTRRPKLNLMTQDSLVSNIFLRDALLAHFEGDDVRAIHHLNESIDLLERWKK